ncbi:MAG TPA: hypothetical protein DEG17_18240 [Cyanobacteria bacterium UBA11149]|nr:hypothetical protein [Cyanobacteria bacterium UBA11367]HBE58452.1 hypothetical protein [Cyanobacteria bacterium UBA11366]HBK65495.1 hypothetical protein [Cyanobacteria bacterium UBA11166]HBR73479.1 hypothetical protein [Cyanobacteria bacterium UBA11159]HBS71812.1 hypothetical protein [Cyanobacteria bacterium UBA11153]HBW90757.1 hypothetical protein [Cyanobacteria bacterium UBA11149]
MLLIGRWGERETREIREYFFLPCSTAPLLPYSLLPTPYSPTPYSPAPCSALPFAPSTFSGGLITILGPIY